MDGAGRLRFAPSPGVAVDGSLDMWLHERQQIPGGNQITLAACGLCSLAASVVPDLTAGQRFEAVMLVPVAFFATFGVSRLVLPLLGGETNFGKSLATVLFYGGLVAGTLGFLLAYFGIGPMHGLTAGDRAYYLATSLPAGWGLAAAALHRVRTFAAAT